MANKIPINCFLHLSRRSYAVAEDNVGVQTAASVMRKGSDSGCMRTTEVAGGEQSMKMTEVAAGDHKKPQAFWMRDPKTGNWIPESHFGDVDVVDLRDKFLSKKDKP